MLITPKMKLSDAILLNYKLIPVINRFGIQLGFGDQTIEEVCKTKRIHLMLFLHIVNAFYDDGFKPDDRLACISIDPLIEYLKSTHDDYLNDKLVMIDKMFDNLKTHKEDKQYIEVLRNFFNNYKIELINHIKDEEDIVFPYVLYLNKYIENQELTTKEKEIIEKYKIQTFKETHDDIEDKLRDMIIIMIKYLNPPMNILLYHHIIQDLFELVVDVNHHTKIENNVLIPKVEMMEKIAKTMVIK